MDDIANLLSRQRVPWAMAMYIVASNLIKFLCHNQEFNLLYIINVSLIILTIYLKSPILFFKKSLYNPLIY